MTKNTQQKRITDEEIRKLVVERLKSFPSSKKISIGSEGNFSREELIEHVETEDRIGRKIIEIQLAYLQSLKEGIITNE